MMNLNTYLIIIVFLIGSALSAQNDTIQLNNNDILVGEVKSLANNVLIIKTSYSDKDFRIEFDEVEGLIIQRKCLIILTNGRRRFGNVRTDKEGLVMITLDNNTIETFKLDEVIRLNEIDDKFWSRIDGSVNLGFNFTKANDNAQFTINGNLNYIDKSWLYEGDISVLSSTQDDAVNIKRTDANLQLIRILPRKWYLLGYVLFLSNTEQALDSR